MDQTIGAKLRQARERRFLNLQQVSESTKVRPHYLQALENDDLSAIPSAAQARGFLGIYAGFLGLDLGELVPAVRPAEPTPPVAASSDSPSIETPNPQGAPHFGIRAWAGARWSKLAGKATRERTTAGPDRSAQSEASKTDPLAQSEALKTGRSAQSEASKTDPLAQSEVLKTDRSAQRETSKTDPLAQSVASEPGPSAQSQALPTDLGESISLHLGVERVEERSRIPAPLKSRIRGMFLDTTVERASSSAEAADETSSRPERGSRGAASNPRLPADTKKKAGN